MNGLSRYGAAVATFAAAAAVAVAAATAAPIIGGQPFQGTWSSDGYRVVVAASAPATCSFPSTATLFGGTNLTAEAHGWIAQRDPYGEHPEVWLHANVHGTYNDRSGDVYRINGEFLQTGTAAYVPGLWVTYDGVGHLSVVGPRGVISGQAEFLIVPDFPQEWIFWFSRIDACTVH